MIVAGSAIQGQRLTSEVDDGGCPETPVQVKVNMLLGNPSRPNAAQRWTLNTILKQLIAELVPHDTGKACKEAILRLKASRW